MKPTDIFPDLRLDNGALVIPLDNLNLTVPFTGEQLAWRLCQQFPHTPVIPQGLALDTVRLRYNYSYDIAVVAVAPLAEPVSNSTFFGNQQLTNDLQLTN